MPVPHTFATQSGNVPASQLDDNFAALLPIGGWAANIVLGTTGAGNVGALTATQLYNMLKGSLPWEVSGFMGGVQGAGNWQILRWQSGVSNVIINQGNCIASASTAATASAVFNILDNGANIGTMTFGAGAVVGTFALTTSPYTLTQGHVLVVQGPLTPDTTLADVNLSLGGTRG